MKGVLPCKFVYAAYEKIIFPKSGKWLGGRWRNTFLKQKVNLNLMIKLTQKRVKQTYFSKQDKA